MQAARLEAIKKNTSVKVQYDSTMRRFWGFVDNDQDGVEDSGERRIAEVVDIGKSVQFRGPGDSAPNGAAAIDNWDTLTPATNGPTFRFDGSVDDVGAYRLSDSRDNVLEVRVSTAATGRIVIQKWDRAANIFRAAGENVSSENGIQPSWTWY
jgi:hypothetical protein